MLAKKKENSSLSRFDLNKEIPYLYKEYPFLKEVEVKGYRNLEMNRDLNASINISFCNY